MALTKQFSANTSDQSDGTFYDFEGGSVEDIASQLKEVAGNGADVSTVTVFDEHGSIRGWAHPDGTWTAQ